MTSRRRSFDREEADVTDSSGSETATQMHAAKEEAVNRTQDLSSSAAEHVGAMKEDVKGKAVGMAHDVRRELETQGDAQARRLASTLKDVGGQVRDMADGAQPGAVTDVTRQIAVKSQEFAQRLETGGVAGMGDDLRAFARRQPGLFLAAAGLAGFTLTRVLRNASSSSREAPSANFAQTGQRAAPLPLLADSPSAIDRPRPEVASREPLR
jgi:hypothetical protein